MCAYLLFITLKTMLGLWTANKHMMNAEQMKLVRKMEVLVS